MGQSLCTRDLFLDLMPFFFFFFFFLVVRGRGISELGLGFSVHSCTKGAIGEVEIMVV